MYCVNPTNLWLEGLHEGEITIPPHHRRGLCLGHFLNCLLAVLFRNIPRAIIVGGFGLSNLEEGIISVQSWSWYNCTSPTIRHENNRLAVRYFLVRAPHTPFLENWGCQLISPKLSPPPVEHFFVISFLLYKGRGVKRTRPKCWSDRKRA
jgi:hypothetical protein